MLSVVQSLRMNTLTHLEAPHITWVAGILKAVLVALEEELEEESESRRDRS